jgi:hypothetical protein
MNTSIILLDLTSIPEAPEGFSLFVSGVHIMGVDEQSVFAVEEVSSSLSTALETEVKDVKISEEQLAKTVAKRLGKSDILEQQIKSGDVHYNDWNKNHTADDILAYIAQ